MTTVETFRPSLCRHDKRQGGMNHNSMREIHMPECDDASLTTMTVSESRDTEQIGRRLHGAVAILVQLVVLSCITTTSVFAELIVYEPFDHTTVDQPLVDSGGGFGLSGTWRPTFGSTSNDAIRIAEQSLSFPGLVSRGNRALLSEPLFPDRFIALRRNLETVIGDNETTTKYLSFLLRPEHTEEGFFLVGLDGTDIAALGGALMQRNCRECGAPSYSIDLHSDGLGGPSSNVRSVPGETSLLVLKAELKEGIGDFTLYVNPIPGQPEPQLGTTWNDVQIGSVRGIDVGGSSPFSVDEIRLGETFADVTPSVPLSVTELIGIGDEWAYFPGTSEPSSFPNLEWARSAFDDSNWERANEGFGYGSQWEDELQGTILDEMKGSHTTLYLRHEFSVPEPSAVSHLALTVNADDGFIAYINGLEVARSFHGTIDSPEPFDATFLPPRPGDGPQNFIVDLSSHDDLLRSGDDNVLAIQGINFRLSDRDFRLSDIRLQSLATVAAELQAGDADQDLDFDQLDLVRVLTAAKYLTAEPATWGDGDWNGASGGSPGDPPAGDGQFNQLDIVAALANGFYLTGPYHAVQSEADSVFHDSSVDEQSNYLSVNSDALVGEDIMALHSGEMSGVFANAHENLITVPEPASMLLATIGIFNVILTWRRQLPMSGRKGQMSTSTV